MFDIYFDIHFLFSYRWAGLLLVVALEFLFCYLLWHSHRNWSKTTPWAVLTYWIFPGPSTKAQLTSTMRSSLFLRPYRWTQMSYGLSMIVLSVFQRYIWVWPLFPAYRPFYSETHVQVLFCRVQASDWKHHEPYPHWHAHRCPIPLQQERMERKPGPTGKTALSPSRPNRHQFSNIQEFNVPVTTKWRERVGKEEWPRSRGRLLHYPFRLVQSKHKHQNFFLFCILLINQNLTNGINWSSCIPHFSYNLYTSMCL